MTQPAPSNSVEPESKLGCMIFAAVWGLWAAAMFGRTWHISRTVDGAGPFEAAFLAVLFGFVTLEGIFLYHLPAILALGGFIATSILKNRFPRLPKPIIWVVSVLGGLLAAAFYVFGASDTGCDPLRQLGCI